MSINPTESCHHCSRIDEARGDPALINPVPDRDATWEVVDGFPFSQIYNAMERVWLDF